MMPSMPPTHRPARVSLPDGRPSAARRGYDARWRVLRLVVLRDRPVCEDCHRAASHHVDHVDGDVANTDLSNLRALCHSCHSKKTVARDHGFGRTPREQG
jgi:5-methylcytosine-specific restriction protein A